MIKINDTLLSKTAAKAEHAQRQRCNHNFHEKPSDPINRMLNAMKKGAYFPPHKHEDPDKREVFIILRGRVLMVEYDDSGRIKDHIVLDPKAGSFGVEFSPGTWHSLVPLEDMSVLYEMKDGPYDKNADKTFADWAPRENEEGAREFVHKVLKEAGLE